MHTPPAYRTKPVDRQQMRKANVKSKKRKTKRALARTDKSGKTFLYVLVSCLSPGRSYVGVTNDMGRRIRQHNGEISGGAKYTTRSKPWRVHALFQVSSRHDALCLEWKVKHRKSRTDGKGVEGRVCAMQRLGLGVPGFVRCV